MGVGGVFCFPATPPSSALLERLPATADGASPDAVGIEYEARMDLLDEVTWPKPLANLLEPAFITYRRTNPWLLDAELSPKSVVRDMLEKAMSFGDLISV